MPAPSRHVPRELNPVPLFIHGEFRPARTGETLPHLDPTTEEETARYAKGSVDDLHAAVDAAEAAFHAGWGRLNGHERGRALWRVADGIERHGEELARMETLDMGKPIADLRAVDIPHLANTFRYFAGWASKLDGTVRSVAGDLHTFTVREPLGVVGCITPFNFPLVLSVHKFAPALACGNTVVHKPADKTPLGAALLARIVHEAGLPPGVFNVVNGDGAELGDAISAHPKIKKVAFTGSTKVGQGIIRKTADAVKHVTMELGGKSPNVIFADADLDRAVELAFQACFFNKGEICFAGSRLLVERSVHDRVVEGLVRRLAAVRLGDPLDPETQMGPQASKADLEHVLKYLDIGREEGAKIATGGGRHDIGTGRGYFVQPTVFTGVHNRMRIAQEEIFGPVLSVIPFEGFDEAMRLANDIPYGLAAGVHTRDMGKALRASRELQAGMVWINAYGRFDPAASFGGYKLSGYGRELGPESLEAYTQTKTVWMSFEH